MSGAALVGENPLRTVIIATPGGILSESTSCWALLVKGSVPDQTNNPRSSSSDQNFNLMRRISHERGASFQFESYATDSFVL